MFLLIAYLRSFFLYYFFFPVRSSRDMKQNKGTILRASVDYIKILRRHYDHMSLVEEKCQMLTEQNSSLQDRIGV